jgi:hypothetical protein
MQKNQAVSTNDSVYTFFEDLIELKKLLILID